MSSNEHSNYIIPSSVHSPVDEAAIRSNLYDLYDTQVGGNKPSIDIQIGVEADDGRLSELIGQIAEEISAAREEHLNYRLSNHEINKGNFMLAVSKKLFRGSMSVESIQKSLEDDIKSIEAEIGGEIFGKPRAGERQLFFYDQGQIDKVDQTKTHSFFYHKEIRKRNILVGAKTLHFEIKQDSVMCVSNEEDENGKAGMKCRPVTGKELQDLATAAQMLRKKTYDRLYKPGNPYSGKTAA